ncbi:MAG: N-acetylglucosamine-6-phosphate deacetylase [Treponema sp.]|jgi:N-acetylglucosamine-6-phosphate deacetylase|nr:N-acetylglucosamine-6-phosphate deacetylase [Treponema sp.]
MLIRCDRIFDEKSGGFIPGEIVIRGERFDADAGEGGEALDYRGCYALPGFIDIHTHGVFGEAYFEASPERIAEMCRYIAGTGVTAVCPATVTGGAAALEKGAAALAASAAFRGSGRAGNFRGAEIIGIYQEGPFLSPKKPGAADLPSFRKPDAAFFKKLCGIAGEKGIAIRFVVIAPELEGGLDFIREISGGEAPSAVCTMAHTTAGYETGRAAIERGASQITHLFNAMPPLLHREPGIIGAAFDAKNVKAELIADGVHVHPAMVRAAFELFGDDRIVLISDSIFSGLPDGAYSAGKLKVTVRGGAARNRQGALAGSCVTLGECVMNAVKNIGIPLYSAVKCASVNPAKQSGVFHERGSIAPGKFADLVLLNDDLSVRDVLVRGKWLRENGE